MFIAVWFAIRKICNQTIFLSEGNCLKALDIILCNHEENEVDIYTNKVTRIFHLKTSQKLLL